MKNILVTIDFSENTHNAALFAAGLAKITGARIILFHVFNPVLAQQQVTSTNNNTIFETVAQELLDNLAHELHQNYGVSVTRLIKPGFAEDEVPSLAKRIRADLVTVAVSNRIEEPEIVPGILETELLQNANVAVLRVPARVNSQDNVLITVLQATSPVGNNQLSFNVVGQFTLEEAIKEFEEQKVRKEAILPDEPIRNLSSVKEGTLPVLEKAFSTPQFPETEATSLLHQSIREQNPESAILLLPISNQAF